MWPHFCLASRGILIELWPPTRTDKKWSPLLRVLHQCTGRNMSDMASSFFAAEEIQPPLQCMTDCFLNLFFATKTRLVFCTVVLYITYVHWEKTQSSTVVVI